MMATTSCLEAVRPAGMSREAFMVGSYIRPTLTEQGIDVDEFIRQNHRLIERLRKGNH